MQVKIHSIRYYRVRCQNAHKPYTSIYKRDRLSQYLRNSLRRGYQKTGSFKEGATAREHTLLPGRGILSPCTAGAYLLAAIKRLPEMRKGAHLIIGILAFLGYAYLISLIRETTSEFFILGLFAVVTGSLMPDILEAPTSWRHRGIFHSKRALKCMVGTFGITAAAGLLPSPLISHAFLVSGISCFALGYLFHLLADSTTKRGLPE
jgi:hypothetical protein